MASASMGRPDGDAARIVESAASSVRQARLAEQARTRAAVERVAAVARASIESRGRALLHSLERELAPHDRHGVPFPVLRAMGQADREKPYNRLLGWLLRASPDHGVALAALRLIAERLAFPELADDLRQHPDQIDVRPELPWPPEAGSRKEPDLLVLTPRALLLIESKLHCGESGDQYGPYREALERLAAARQASARRAYLLAPDDREAPEGWSGRIRHAELASWLEELARSRDLPTWDRVLCRLVTDVFAGRESEAERVRRARALLVSLRGRAITAADVASVAQVLPLPKAFEWEEGIDEGLE